ncbi:MAG TPA: alpha/beta fold hydrolase, partial [Anaerolineae bacterium]
ITYVFIRPIHAAYLFTRPPRIRISFFTPKTLGADYVDVTLTSSDGVKLEGWYVPSRNGAAVILLHGHSGNRLGVVFPAEALIKAGFGVLLFDLRAHGSSGGRRFARCEAVVADVLAAVAYLSKRPDVKPGSIGIFGVSVGGLLALQAAARTVTIRAVATDGASPAVYADVPPPHSWLDHFFRLPLQRYYMKAIDWFARVPHLPANVDLIPRLAPRPLLFIAAARSGEQRMVRRYYDVAKEPKALWEIPDARHVGGWSAQPELYERQIVTFFARALVTRPTAGVSLLPVNAIGSPEPEQPEVQASIPSGYQVAYDATISMVWANVIALLMLPAVFLLFLLPFGLLWGQTRQIISVDLADVGVMILALLLGIVTHELLHAIGFVYLGKVRWSAVKFGFSWKGLAPYAHCRQPLAAAAYRASGLLPGVVLGLIPGLIGVVTGSRWLVLWGTIMLIAAGGDLAVWWAIRSVPTDALVLDHPIKAGCQVLKEDNS